MPDRAGTHEVTDEGVTALVIVLPRGGSVTVQLNPYLLIEHPINRCVLRVNALLVGLWKYFPLYVSQKSLYNPSTLTFLS